tara:strand:+ start:34 stop:1179 length:1146 start_codon:yes stop_codon:yes gene_type:complete
MKILHTITSLDKGGAENHVASLGIIQKQNYDNVKFFISKNSKYWIKPLKKNNIQVFKAHFFFENNFLQKLLKLFKDVRQLVLIINKYKPNILHAHLPYMEIVSYCALFFSSNKPKFIISKHVDNVYFQGSIGQKRNYFGGFLEKTVSKKASSIIAISKSVKRFFISDYVGVDKKKIKVIYYGINKSNILKNNLKKNNLKKKYKLLNNELKIGCIARLVPQKAIDNLILSLSLINKHINIKLIIVGKGPLKKELQFLAKKLKVENKIIWIDFIDRVQDFYETIDLFVLTSRYEGLGFVFLESMIFKKPIITCNTSAMPEIIKNNYNGFLVPPNNPKFLAKTILKLKDKKKRKKLGFNGYLFVKKNMSLIKMFNKINSVYKNK